MCRHKYWVTTAPTEKGRGADVCSAPRLSSIYLQIKTACSASSFPISFTLITLSQNFSKLNIIPGLSASSSRPTTEQCAPCIVSCNSDASLSDMEHSPSVINRISAFSNDSSRINRSASRSGDSKPVPRGHGAGTPAPGGQFEHCG